MAGILTTNRKIDSARKRIEALEQKAKALKKDIRESSKRLEYHSERICGRAVLHLLSQGVPLSPEAIMEQAQASTRPKEQDALDRLIELIQSDAAVSDSTDKIKADPNVRFRLNESQNDVSTLDPVQYQMAENCSIEADVNFPSAAPDIQQNYLKVLIDAEGPITREVAHRRMAQMLGLSHAYTAVKDAINNQLDAMKEARSIFGDGNSFWPVDCHIRPRERPDIFRNMFSFDQIPKIELHAAIIHCLARQESTKMEIIASVSSQLGYKSIRDTMKSRINSVIDNLYKDKRIVIAKL